MAVRIIDILDILVFLVAVGTTFSIVIHFLFYSVMVIPGIEKKRYVMESCSERNG